MDISNTVRERQKYDFETSLPPACLSALLQSSYDSDRITQPSVADTVLVHYNIRSLVLNLPETKIFKV